MEKYSEVIREQKLKWNFQGQKKTYETHTTHTVCVVARVYSSAARNACCMRLHHYVTCASVTFYNSQKLPSWCTDYTVCRVNAFDLSLWGIRHSESYKRQKMKPFLCLWWVHFEECWQASLLASKFKSWYVCGGVYAFKLLVVDSSIYFLMQISRVFGNMYHVLIAILGNR